MAQAAVGIRAGCWYQKWSDATDLVREIESFERDISKYEQQSGDLISDAIKRSGVEAGHTENQATPRLRRKAIPKKQGQPPGPRKKDHSNQLTPNPLGWRCLFFSPFWFALPFLTFFTKENSTTKFCDFPQKQKEKTHVYFQSQRKLKNIGKVEKIKDENKKKMKKQKMKKMKKRRKNEINEINE